MQPEAVSRITFHDGIVAMLAVLIASRMEKQQLDEFCTRLERWTARYPRANINLASRYRNAVCVVSRHCRSQRGCLLRSLAVVVACRISHHSVIWCTGFVVQPFCSHAWVEVNGKPIGEPTEVSDYIVTRSSDK